VREALPPTHCKEIDWIAFLDSNHGKESKTLACSLFFDESSMLTLPLPTLLLYFPVKKRTPSTRKPFAALLNECLALSLSFPHPPEILKPVCSCELSSTKIHNPKLNLTLSS
jgi:hypothetical protein